MPVFLTNNERLQKFSYNKITSDGSLCEKSDEFFKNKVDKLEPNSCLYIGQREYATVRYTDDKINIIGSDDATTCHIVLLVDPITKNSSLCHFDGSDMSEGYQNMISSLKSLNPDSSNFDLYIIGGFLDNRKISYDVTLELFNIFLNAPENLKLKLCVVTKLNDTIKDGTHFPAAYGLGYNIKTESVFMCNTFVDKGPDSIARSARHFAPNGNMNIFDTMNSKLTIGPFDYEPIDQCERLMQFPEHVLLKYFSTSPEQEPASFITNLKKTFKIMHEHPKPLDTYFKDMKPFIYSKKDDGSWEL